VPCLLNILLCTAEKIKTLQPSLHRSDIGAFGKPEKIANRLRKPILKYHGAEILVQ